MTITAIETRYAGCRFRSRLEARWAVFFDTLDIPWVYELQGYALPSGSYLPDFYLPSIDAWYEVKGEYRTQDEWQLAGELAAATGKTVYVAWGDLPREGRRDGTRSDIYGATYRDIDLIDAFTDDDGNVDYAGDFGYTWCRCPRCDTFTIQYSGRGLRHCDRNEADGRVDTAHDRRILDAYTTARSARFEHGEAPATSSTDGYVRLATKEVAALFETHSVDRSLPQRQAIAALKLAGVSGKTEILRAAWKCWQRFDLDELA